MSPFAGVQFASPEVIQHAPALMIAAPLTAACVAALSPSARWAWFSSLGGALFALWMALCLAADVAQSGVVSYAVGGFAPPLGIELRVDDLGVFFSLLVSILGVATSLASASLLRLELPERDHALMQAGFMLALTGLLGLTATGDAFNAFVFLEVSSIGTYALVAMGASRDRRALTAAFQYLIMGTIGATFFVIGVGLLYSVTGTLNMTDMAEKLSASSSDRAAIAGLVLITVGLALKAAMFPLHAWLPGAYSAGPSVVVAFLAGTATKVSVYLLIRFLMDVAGGLEGAGEGLLNWLIAPMAGIAAVVASVQAVFQTETRRILAFSSIAQIGYVLLGVTSGSVAGLTAALFLLFAHAMIKTVIFLCLGAIGHRGAQLETLAGAGREAPWTITALAIAMLGLAGAPFTAGFLAKWRLLGALADGGRIWAVVAIAVSSLTALVYCARILETMVFRTRRSSASGVSEASPAALAAIWFLAASSVWYGLDASALYDLARQAAASAMGASS
ncbi:MAG: monovalent cation/H+ antiporter subunit D family protein [Alphaproteobacteria bacterium]|nr:monovalent cation/H+ antiporter subunit D family protein [Alphaproteobacteria bacterium]